jgi:hypothetical protein
LVYDVEVAGADVEASYAGAKVARMKKEGGLWQA